MEELTWNSRSATASVTYQVSSHFSFIKTNHFDHADDRQLSLIAYNARDLGYAYLYVDPKKSQNITWMGTNGKAARLGQFIHRGGSCGYPGGCNNMSPYIQELEMKVKSLSARAYIKLWRRSPKDVNAVADMTFIIDMI